MYASAQEALAAGDVTSARTMLLEATKTGPAPAEHLQLGRLIFAMDELEEGLHHLEIAFREFRAAKEPRAAARAAADLANVHLAGFDNHALARGWVERGRRVLEPVGRCVEQGYLDLSQMACTVVDFDEWERRTASALELAIEFEDPDLEVRALADSGFGLIAAGRVEAGFARLDEAMAMISSGEVANMVEASKSFCAMLTACDRVGDLRRAEEWTAVVGALLASQHGRPRVLYTHCRTALGSVLCGIGRWREAERTLLEALASTRWQKMIHTIDASVHLADLRVSQGRLEEADELLTAHHDHVNACAPVARLHLARGEADLAAAAVQRGLRMMTRDRLRSAPLLALGVQADLVRGDIDAADRTARALAVLAADAPVASIGAESALATARVAIARGETEAALAALDEAERAIADAECPALCGQIRMERALLLTDADSPAGAIGEARAALAVFERLGARRETDRATALLRRLGDTGRQRPRASLDALTAREREVLDLVRGGLTNAEIGQRLYISAKTAEHHVSRVLSKLGARSRAEAAALK